MAEVVDSIIAELIAKADGYVATFDQATAAHGRFKKSVDALKGQTFDLAAEGQKYKAGADGIANAEDGLTQRVTRSRKVRADAVKTADVEEAASAKRTADVKIAEAERVAAREAQLDANAAKRVIYDRVSSPARPPGYTIPNADLSREGIDRQDAIARRTSVAPAAQEVAAEKEVNQLAADRAKLASSIAIASGKEKQELQDISRELMLIQRLQAAGVSETEIAIELERRQLAIETERAAVAAKQNTRNLTRFAEGAGLGRSYGSVATVGGIAAAAGVGITVEAVKSATDFAKALTDVSQQVGLTTTQLQVYQTAAAQAGVSQQQFQTALGTLASNLGRAREGSQEQVKIFAALGVNIKTAASAGDLLPTLIQRISSIPDQAQRAAIETRLFGEEGRKLDTVLSGGNAAINDLAAAMEKAGAVLSPADIAHLDDVSKKLEQVKAQLSVDLAQVVAGNADVIESLAKSFAGLADDIAGAIRAFQQFENTGVGKFLSDPIGAGAKIRQSVLSAIGLGGDEAAPAKTGASPAIGKPVQPGAVNPGLLATLGAPKPPKGKSADDLQNEADQRTKRFNDEMARYLDQRLAAAAQQTSDEEARRDAERAAIDRDSARQVEDLKTQARIDTRKAPADAKLIAARLDQAVAAEQAAAQEKKNVINLESTVSSIDRDVAAQNAILEFKNQQLQAQEELAKTAAERRDLELQILANEQQIAKNSAEAVLRKADQGAPTSTADIQAANRTLANLPADTEAKKSVILDRTKGPLQSYFDSLPNSAKKVDEAFQNAAVHGVEALNDSLDTAITKTLHLHGLAGQLLEDFLKIALQSAEGSLFGGGGGGLGGLLGGIGKLFGGGSGGGGFLSGIGSLTTSFGTLPGFASGGSFEIGGNGGVDRNLLSINGKPVVRVNQGETVAVIPKDIGSGNGRVTNSNQQMNLHQTINIDSRSSITPSDFATQILSASADHANKVAAQAGARAVNASPARVRQSQTLGN